MNKLNHKRIGDVRVLLEFISLEGKHLILCVCGSKYFKHLKTNTPYIVLYGNEQDNPEEFGATPLQKFVIRNSGKVDVRHAMTSDRVAVNIFQQNYVNNINKVNLEIQAKT